MFYIYIYIYIWTRNRNSNGRRRRRKIDKEVQGVPGDFIATSWSMIGNLKKCYEERRHKKKPFSFRTIFFGHTDENVEVRPPRIHSLLSPAIDLRLFCLQFHFVFCLPLQLFLLCFTFFGMIIALLCRVFNKSRSLVVYSNQTKYRISFFTWHWKFSALRLIISG